MNGSNQTRVNLVIDTRNQWSFLFDSNCTTCNNTNKYSKHPNATIGSFPFTSVRHLTSVNGYSTNDTLCVADSNVGGIMKCARDRVFGVITEQSNFNAP